MSFRTLFGRIHTASNGAARGRHRKQGLKRGTAVLASFALLAAGLVAVPAALIPTAASAAGGALEVIKTVNGGESATLAPGQEFTYEIAVACQEENCVSAQLTDALPAELAGFQVLAASTSPSSVPTTVAFSGTDCTRTLPLPSGGFAASADCTVTVDYREALGAPDLGSLGIKDGTTATLTLTLRVPSTLPATWPSNGVPFDNTATATATGSTSDTSDPATVTVNIPVTVDTEVTKAWSPASQQFNPGVDSTITLGIRNTSNVEATSLTIQDPQTAADGAATLDTSNPFTIVDFTGFGTITPPQGADLVQVYAYVLSGGSWNWVTSGTAVAPSAIALPAGVTADQVGGIRLEFTSSTGDTIAANGTAGSIALGVEQRETNRNSGDALTLGANVSNVTAGTVSVPGQSDVTKTATAPYAITGLNVTVEAGKTITPGRIPAGTTASANITAKNSSNGPLSALTLSDKDFFTEDLGFGGFTAPLAYPEGATAATVTWFFSGGTDSGALAFADGDSPAAASAPSGQHVTGFEITYTASPAGIVAGTTTEAVFDIVSDATLVPGTETSVEFTNTVDVSGTNSAGTSTASDNAPLEVFYPDINVVADKVIKPSGPVQPGGTVVAQLSASTSTDSAFVDPTEISLTDSWRQGEADDFWNAFNAYQIAPTQVVTGTTVTVEFTTDGTTWHQLDFVDATSAGLLYQADIQTLLNGLSSPSGVQASAVTGLRFVFEDVDGFGQGTTVQPNVVFQARDTLRTGGPTSIANDPESRYENLVTVQGTGSVPGLPTVTSDPDTAVDDAGIISYSGVGSIGSAKYWFNEAHSSQVTEVPSQSGSKVATRLDWGVNTPGFSSVSIIDPVPANGGDPEYYLDHPEDTVFQGFNLTALSAQAYSNTEYSNGWYLKWDTVTSVELYYGGQWNTVTAPGGSWMSTSGFRGYTLSSTEAANTTGVRISLEENTAARAASSDPLRPAPGSGVASSGSSRSFWLDWQLRDKVRVGTGLASQWVSEAQEFNDAEAGSIVNTVRVEGVSGGSTSAHDNSDTISLTDYVPSVDVTKTSNVSSVTVPYSEPTSPFTGDVAPADYPKVNFTVTAANQSFSDASYLRVTDPMQCTTSTLASCASTVAGVSNDPFASSVYNAATNPFERLTLTNLTFTVNTAEVSKAASVITMRKLNPILGTQFSQQITIANFESLSTAARGALLEDAVGISVLYQGVSPTNDGGTIKRNTSSSDTSHNATMVMNTTLRKFVRSNSSTLVSAYTVENYAFGQSYDPVLYPDGRTGAIAFDSANRAVQLRDGVIEVTASKSFTPDTVIEANPGEPVVLSIGATDGNSTISTNKVVIEDGPEQPFWNYFAFTGLGTVTKPAGAGLVQVDVYGDFGSGPVWVPGTAAATATVPVTSADYPKVTGIRFTFTRSGGGLFSTTAPPADWSANALVNLGLLETARDGDPVPFPGSTSNVQTSTSTHVASDQSPTATATDDFTMGTGTFALDVAKDPAGGMHSVDAGEPNEWTLKFRNSGTGYLTIDQVTDQLPADLEWDGEDATFSNNGGSLSEDVTTDYDTTDRDFTFTWPTTSNANRLAPGDSFTITLGLILKPGVSAGTHVTNSFTVNTGQTLAACTNTSGNGQGILSGSATDACGTSNYVQPNAVPNISAYKGVKGAVNSSLVNGATNVSNPSGVCLTDADGFYRSPCAANSVEGAADLWKLQVTNSGTFGATQLTVVDPLPFVGDKNLQSGSSRGSTYRPVFDSSFAPTLLAGSYPGVTYTWQVTTDANVCVGSGSTSNWPSNPTCTTNTWVNSGLFSGNWDNVTGIRVIYNFAGTAAGNLPPGAVVKLAYQTVNKPATSAQPDLAPVTVPVGDAFAWNSMGAWAQFTNNATKRVTPSKAGVKLAVGPISLQKELDGGATVYAADDFVIDVECTIAGAPINLGGEAQQTLNSANSYLYRIDGIPLGAECVQTEEGPVGTFGESGRSDSSITVDVDTQSGTGGTVPLAQAVTLTNEYDWTGLSITKTVDTAATVGDFGPFDYTLACVSLMGDDVTLNAADAEFTLADGDTHTVASETIPVGASCTLTETDTDLATDIVVTGTGVDDQGDGIAVITVDAAGVDATVTNSYDAAGISVSKTVDGDGAATYGSGPFTASVVCVYDGDEIYTGSVSLVGGDTKDFVDADGDPVLLPTGTECALTEPATGGATQTGFTLEGAPVTSVTVPAGDAEGEIELVLTNTFDTGSLVITKDRVGEGAAAYGAGPFTVQVVCTFDKDGVATPIDLGSSATLTLDEGNGYTQTITDLLVGADCVVTEDKDGFATSVAYSPVDGIADPIVIDDGTGAPQSTVTVTNTFDVGSLVVTKTVTGNGADSYGSGPFTIAVKCTYEGTTFFDGSFTILGGESHDVGQYPVGTECTVRETVKGGATSTTIDTPSVIIPALAAGETTSLVTVDVTNTFTAGKLKIVKKREGDGIAAYGSGPFTAQVTCTWVKDGTTLTVALPKGGVVSLSKANKYRATIGDLPLGAYCKVVETDAGLAIDTSYSPASGKVRIVGSPAPTATVTITNTFAIGKLKIDKVADKTDVTVGDIVTYTITVTNVGGLDAEDLTVTDVMPAGLQYVSSNKGGKVVDGNIQWTIDRLKVGKTITFTLKATVVSAGDVTNGLTVTTPDGSWDPSDVENQCSSDSAESCATVNAAEQTPPVPNVANTGNNAVWSMAGFAVLLLLGGVVIMLARRRRPLL